MRSVRLRQVAVFLVLAGALQLGAIAVGKPFWQTQLTMSAYYALVAVGLSLLMGYAGQISLGHAGFFAVGGYGSALLTTWDLSAHKAAGVLQALQAMGAVVARPDPFGGTVLTVHPWPAAVVAVLLAMAAAWLVGIPVLKLSGHYLAMATLGVGTIIAAIAVGTQALGAADGISGVPPLPLLLGVGVGGATSQRVANYWVAIGLLAVCMILLLNLVDSRVGRALRAIHGAEDAADAMGVDTARYKLHTFVVSAGLAALAGVFLTHFNGGIGPSEASIMKSVKYVAMVAVGGMGSLWGTLGVSLLLNFLSLRGYFGTLDDAVFGAILIGIMLFSPDGIMSPDLRRILVAGWRRLRPAPASVEKGASEEGR
ncbi:MAG: branched-chain amino acid ABC transporter permease [Deltaproteobacteria bacterium]|nr:branched-chain amino acid ABC transporter permease [Deltaproteobacteria bacterium]